MTEPAPLFLSRARVRADAPVAALRDLLIPADDGARLSTGHQLVWTLFADAPDRERDFLWREWEPGHFLILSRRPPSDQHGMFRLDEPKEFAPRLSVGDRLQFSLRANATVAKSLVKGKRGAVCDVVMDALRAVSYDERGTRRPQVIQDAGRRWLEAQATRSGFRLMAGPDAVRVMGYRQLRLRRRGASAASVSVLDFEGTLEVEDPSRFFVRLGEGFGRAKAFGCGLMLIRRG